MPQSIVGTINKTIAIAPIIPLVARHIVASNTISVMMFAMTADCTTRGDGSMIARKLRVITNSAISNRSTNQRVG